MSLRPVGHRKRLVGGALFVVLVVLVGVAGCSSQGEVDPLSAGLTPAAEARGNIRGEFEELAETVGTLSGYQFRLMSTCMAEKGFVYPVPAVGDGPPVFERTFGFEPTEVSRGYPEEMEELPPDPTEAITNQLPPDQRIAYDDALFGDGEARTTPTLADGSGEISMPGEGCVAEANHVMFGSAGGGAAVTDLASNLPIEAIAAAQRDPLVEKLNGTWSSCMKERGHPSFATPEEAISWAREQGTTTPEGIDVAQDDAACEAESDYASTRREVEDRYLTGALESRQDEILGARETLHHATDAARKALSKS